MLACIISRACTCIDRVMHTYPYQAELGSSMNAPVPDKDEDGKSSVHEVAARVNCAICMAPWQSCLAVNADIHMLMHTALAPA